jgi:hypothetical protein
MVKNYNEKNKKKKKRKEKRKKKKIKRKIVINSTLATLLTSKINSLCKGQISKFK